MEHVSPSVIAPVISKEVVVMLDLHFKPGTTGTVLKNLIPAIERTRAEAGNLDLRFYKAEGCEDRFVMFERWRDQEALESLWKQLYPRTMLELFNEHLVNVLSERVNVRYLDNVMASR